MRLVTASIARATRKNAPYCAYLPTSRWTGAGRPRRNAERHAGEWAPGVPISLGSLLTKPRSDSLDPSGSRYTQTVGAITLASIFGGPLRSNDTRRFLLEAMLGAIHADGRIDPREMALLHTHIAQHPVLIGLPTRAVTTMLEMASEGIRYAGTAVARVDAIARGLPSRMQRLTAFALAVEVCVVDGLVVDAERAFIETLRIALRMSVRDVDDILRAVERGELRQFLEDRFARLCTLTPVVLDVLALRAKAQGHLHDAYRFALQTRIQQVIDLQLGPTLDAELYAAFRRIGERPESVAELLQVVAAHLPDAIDRYWMVVYALLQEPAVAIAHWRITPFVGLLQTTFQLSEVDMQHAAHDAGHWVTLLPPLNFGA